MSLVKYTFLVVSLTLVHSSVAEMAEVGYAPQKLVAAQQYMVFRPTFARGDDIHGYGHVYERAGEDPESDEGGHGGHGHGGQGDKDEGDENKGGNVHGGGKVEDESLELRDFEIPSSEFEDNSATSPYGGSLVLTALLAAGSAWTAIF
ncbi:hypothetical protein GGI13_008022 [Coemansia sp. RSA 455]|nr:hypothetical protein GGI13_008022 [Coemansia sp. RSA 455]